MDELEKLEAKISEIVDDLARGPKPFGSNSLSDCLGRMEIPIDGINAYLSKLFGPHYESIGCTISYQGSVIHTVYSNELCQRLFPRFENINVSDTIILRFFLDQPLRDELPVLHEDIELTFHRYEYEIHHNGNAPISCSTPYFNYLDPSVIRKIEESFRQSLSRKLAESKG